MVVGLVLGASGMLAACTRPLTAVALASPAAVPRKPLREIMIVSLTCAGLAGGYRHGVCSFLSVARSAAAGERCLELHRCQPEVALGLNRRDGRRHALARLCPPRKNVDQHRGVAKQRVVGDGTSEPPDVTSI